MRGHATTSVRLTTRRRALFSITVLLLAVALSACTFTTDTVATVGGERITWGEVNAEARATQQPTATTLNYLINNRLLEIEARAQGITVSDGELKAKVDAAVADAGQQVQGQRAQAQATVAASTAQTLRPLINASGGAGLAQADLVTALSDEIGRIQNELDAHGTLLAPAVSAAFIQDHAISLRNALAAKGIALAPSDLESTIAAIVQQLGSGSFTAADVFQQNLAQQGFTSGASYTQNLRLQLLVDKMRASWYKPELDAATFQILVTDSQARASEAVQKGRAGTTFDDLVKTYASAAYQDPQAINSPGSFPLDFLNQTIRTSFPTVKVGQYSDAFAYGQSGLYAVLYITKVERRAPTADEENSIVGLWLRGLRTKYPVTISPSFSTTTAP